MSGTEASVQMAGSALLAPRSRIPAPLWIIAAVTLLLPEEASFFVGDLRLTVARGILIVITPLVIWRGLTRVAYEDYRFVWSDLWVPLAAFWMVLSVWQTEGADRAIVGAGVDALEFTIPYLAARFLLYGSEQAIAFCRLLMLLIAITGLLATLDTITGRFVIHDLFAALTGYIKGWRLDILMRNGLLRAAGPFEHPILLGTICGTGLLIATVERSPSRVWILLGCAIGLAASISAGPIGGTLLGLIFFVYEWLTPGFEGRWRLLMLVGASLLAAFCLISSHPFGTLISHFTFDQQNSYYRLLVWQIAGGLVLDNPLFGIGLTEQWPRPDWMPPTVDALWLRSAMTFGILGSLLILLTMAGAMSRRVNAGPAQMRRFGLALSIALTMLIYTGFTVYYWGATWILIGLLAGLRANLGEQASLIARARTAAQEG
jgi:O-antigen ligase